MPQGLNIVLQALYKRKRLNANISEIVNFIISSYLI